MLFWVTIFAYMRGEILNTQDILDIAIEVISREISKINALSQDAEVLDKATISTLSDLTKTLIQLQKENRENNKNDNMENYSEAQLEAMLKDVTND